MPIIGMGIDIVDIVRVERMLATRGEQALKRLLTPAEATYVASHKAPARHCAVRLAAKEAAYKALGGTESARAIGWRDVEVLRGDFGAPTLLLHGRAEQRAAQLGVTRVHVTLTHSGATAAAVVVLERDG
jgi:holo-[acyl-carrier protein] synthase